MNRKLMFAMLCMAIASAYAIAASIPEPVRMLSDVEKVDIVAGDYCHYCEDCDDGSECGNPRIYCSGTPGQACLSEMSAYSDECFEGSGPLDVGCYDPESHYCLGGYYCYCGVAGGEWVCEDDAVFKWVLPWSFSDGPCP